MKLHSQIIENYNLSFLQQTLLAQHLSLVLQANETTNLTSITSTEKGALLHIEDSLIGLPDLNKAPLGLYGDLGTGGGFPGIPLAIMSGRETILIDSVQKKMAILDSIIAKLGLSQQITTYAGRIEDLALDRPNEFAVLTARALTALPSLLELASPLLKIDGYLICYKTPFLEDEVKQASLLKEKLGMGLIVDREVTLSDAETKRRILVFKKIHHAKVQLPRRSGMAQKRPFAS